jgi:hypothetical protein
MSFIKLDRRLLNWEWKNDPNMVALWIEILLQANYCDAEWHGQKYEKGSFPTSLEKLASATGLTLRQTRTCLERLKTTHELTIETTNKGSKIIVNKWAEYQCLSDDDDTQNDTPNANKRQANDTQNDNTIRNIRNKEDKEIKKRVYVADKKPFVKPSLDDVKSYCIANGFDQISGEKFIAYYEKNDWTVKDRNGKRKKMSNWKICLNTWMVNEARYNNSNELRNRSREAYIKDVEMRQQELEKKNNGGNWFE